MQIQLLEYGSPEYHQMVELRREVLRRPLGLEFTPEQLEAEKKDIIVAGMDDGKVIACCLLTPQDNTVLQLRQMAVDQSLQTKGLGKAIVLYAENWARENGYKSIRLHARDIAIGFYEKCGYSLAGEGFTEVGIPHHLMEKNL